ncbi:MAG: hypothetical protein H5T86_08975, partial [Armatimonadetes bacterium]|nr:hypothetical protein [Armatimonadota bacterium]
MLLNALLVLLAVHAQPGRVLLVTFDSGLSADRNDWGATAPAEAKGFRVTEPGHGCPSNPSGRALDAGFSPDIASGRLAFPIPHDADLRQGTVEFWIKPAWPAGTREVFTFFHIKLRGGT